MECYFDGNNQFYTVGGLILLGLSLGANMMTCAYWPKRDEEDEREEREKPLITSSTYVREEGKVESESDLEMGEVETATRSTNTSPHVCTVRRYTPVWSASHGEKGVAHRADLPDWARKEYLEGKQEREFL